MSKEAMKLALEALENSVDLVREDAYEAEKLYGNYPTRQGKVNGLKVLADDHEKAITALREALAKQPAPVQYRSTGWAAHRDQYAVPVLFNPYSGEPRDVRDVQSDPQGILIVPPGKVEMLAAKPTHHTEQHLEMVAEQPAQQEPVAWEHHAKKLTQWLHCMSYNDSYFGEPAGLVKQVTGELNRLIGTSSQPAQQEPVAIALNTGTKQGVKWLKNVEHGKSLYTSPPAQRTWVGLTDEEINQAYADSYKGILLHEGIEAKLKEKNT